MADYWTTTSTWPEFVSLLLGPTGNYSRGRGVTVITGTLVANYPSALLVDDSLSSPLRIAGTSLKVSVDCGSAVTPNALAIFNHNLPPSLEITFLGSNNANLSSPTLSMGALAAFPCAWVDLRGQTFTASRYWGFEITGVPKAITIGEFVAGSGTVLRGIIDPDHEEMLRTIRNIDVTEYGVPYVTARETGYRGTRVSMTMDPTNRALLLSVLREAGLAGHHLPWFPSTRWNHGFFLESVSLLNTVYENLRTQTLDLEMIEQALGVV